MSRVDYKRFACATLEPMNRQFLFKSSKDRSQFFGNGTRYSLVSRSCPALYMSADRAMTESYPANLVIFGCAAVENDAAPVETTRAAKSHTLA